MTSNNHISETWRERAISFLLENTQAFRDSVEHFVDCYWLTDVSEEENLENFEAYESDLIGVYAY